MRYAILECKDVDIGGIKLLGFFKLLLGQIKLEFFEVFVGSKQALSRCILGSVEL